ncbi:LptA/OstA family protein [Xanthobacteraceae bacterium Astr-EGSB]|uniref:LptA/OstA family protein n=1 Tax=Astrobacterium formosum TaxID=3069710 RepID=UPI0027B44209|nr:LptA/OstA family protein [Xanthobacteraceae bacterium Astr-EGSB]
MTAPFARFAVAVLFAVVLAGAAAAQTAPPNALQGFSQNRNEPVKIDAATLEVRDKQKVATFGGNVKLVQGDTTLTCKTLVVFYDQDSEPNAMKTATPVAPGGGKQSIRRLEAKGDVIVVQKDQKATGDNGIFDMKANTVTLIGNVLISQGPNAIKGDRLVVNLTTGVSRVECDNNPSKRCVVSAIINPNSGPAAGGAKSDGKSEAKPDHKPDARQNGGTAAGRHPARSQGGAPAGLY